MTSEIENLLSSFASLDSKLRNEFEKLVEEGQVDLKATAISAAAYLNIPVSSLKYANTDELFDSLKPYYDVFNFGVLKHVTPPYLLTVHTELTQSIDRVDKFSEFSQLKHMRLTIKEKPSHLPALQSDQTKPVVIKLNDRWKEMTFSKLKIVLMHYFGVTSDLFSHIRFDYDACIITLLTPTTQTQYLIDAINNKKKSMKRLGIMEATVDSNTISIRRADDNNFDASLYQSVKAGDSFEVAMLLQLGADPNYKDEEGKSTVQIAIEGGHNEVITLLTGGANESKINFDLTHQWHYLPCSLKIVKACGFH